jgi:hypothetical protein
MGVAQGPVLLGCGTLLLGEWFLKFFRNVGK